MSKFSYKTRVIKEYKRVIRNGMRMKSRHSGEDVEKVSEKDFMEFLNFSIEALEKQVPKKVIIKKIVENDIPDKMILCPICKDGIIEGMKYCWECGNKLDWSDEDE